MRGFIAYKHCWIAVRPAIQIPLQVYAGPGVEIYNSFFIPFSKHYYVVRIPLNIVTIQLYHF